MPVRRPAPASPAWFRKKELAVREERRFRHALRLSRLPHHMTVEEDDFSHQPELDPGKPRTWPPSRSPGPGPTSPRRARREQGRTHLAVALTVAVCRAGCTIHFTTLDGMVRRLKAADSIGRPAGKLHTCLQPGVLVVDEAGHLPPERDEANLAFRTLSKRYEKGSTLSMSNKSLSERDQVFGDGTSSPPPSSTVAPITTRTPRSTAPATGSRTASPPPKAASAPSADTVSSCAHQPPVHSRCT
ncbi:ATP-binding protein [Streptomyces sp. NPDC007896]|uniref:ATP-binding protein n=1 Tax=Streptomyces sp. NPDC007896 TaxID=3364784 RepID=UPI0036EB1C94